MKIDDIKKLISWLEKQGFDVFGFEPENSNSVVVDIAYNGHLRSVNFVFNNGEWDIER